MAYADLFLICGICNGTSLYGAISITKKCTFCTLQYNSIQRCGEKYNLNISLFIKNAYKFYINNIIKVNSNFCLPRQYGSDFQITNTVGASSLYY